MEASENKLEGRKPLGSSVLCELISPGMGNAALWKGCLASSFQRPLQLAQAFSVGQTKSQS